MSVPVQAAGVVPSPRAADLLETVTIERRVAKSGVWRKFESGTSGPPLSFVPPSLLELGARGILEQVVPDRRRSPAAAASGTASTDPARVTSFVCAVARERVREPVQAADAELERLDQLRAARPAACPGGVICARAVDVELLLVSEAGDALFELRLLQALREQPY